MLAVKRSTFNCYKKALSKQCARSIAVNNQLAYDETGLKSWLDIPGPSYLPIIGHLHHFLPGGLLNDDSIPMATVLAKTYGPIAKLEGFLGSKPLVFIADAAAGAHIIRSENSLPVRVSFESFDYYKKFYRKNKDPDAPLGLITDQGDKWKKIRTTLNSILLAPKITILYKAGLIEVAEDMIKRMRRFRDDNYMLKYNLNTEIELWALESIGVVALGGRLNCLDPELPEDSPARQLVKTVTDIFLISPILDINPNLWRYISTPSFRKAMNSFETLEKLNKFYIKQAIDRFESKDKKHEDDKSVLERLLEIDEDIALTMANDMLFAGVDTVTNTIIKTLYILAINQEKQEKLRAEINLQQDKQPYLKACLKESMRIMPIVMGTVRQTTKEYNVLGYKIPKGVKIIFSNQYLTTLEEHFPRANEYIPERWITDKTDPLHHGNAPPMVYSPFGHGSRICIGKRIAELEMEIFLAKLIENFRIEWTGPPLKNKHYTINYAVAPFNLTFKDIRV